MSERRKPRTAITKKCSEVEWHAEDILVNQWKSKLFKPGTEVWNLSDVVGHVLIDQVLCSSESGWYCGMCGQMIKPHLMWVCECGELDNTDWHHTKVLHY